MAYYDDFKSRCTENGSTPKEYFKNLSKEVFAQKFAESPSSFQVTLNSSSTPIDMQIIDDSEQKEQKVALVPDSVDYNFGDYITWNGVKWITVMLDNMNELYKRGVIKRCFSSLKWLNSDGFIREAHFAYRSDLIRGLGIVDGTYMILPDERRIITIQNNSDTNQIKKLQRFIFDERAWRVTSIDRLETGNINLELEENQIDTAADNLDLRIADYTGKAANYTVNIVESTLSLNVGVTGQLTVEVKNNDVVVTKDITFSSSDETIATVSSAGGLVSGIANGNATVTAKLVLDQTVFDTVPITVSSAPPPDNYTLAVAESPSVIKGYTQQFTSVVKNNGTVVNGRQITWSLWDDTMTTTTNKAVITAYSDTTCTLRGDNYGYLRLKMDLVGTTVSTFIRINVESLI